VGRRRYTRIDDRVRREIIRLAARGLSYSQIIEEVDVSIGSVSNVLRPLGGVLRPEMWEPSRSRLQLEERVEISIGLELGLSLSAIAARIGRVPSTVSREVAANGGRQGYRPFAAHRRACRVARRPKACKLASPRLRARVEYGLRRLWSPQQIARRLREQFPDDASMWISHETVYKSLYVQGRGALRRELAACLRTGRAQRVHQGRQPHAHISGMVLISERPPEVEDRAVPGHWEGDLIIGKNGKSAVATLVERATRYVMLARIADQRAETVRDALADRVARLPAHLWRSLTWDQGSEMARHIEFTDQTGVAVYFCDPHSPWQRGSNENTNGLLRQYMPKGTDLSTLTQANLDAIAISLNGRPRQTLGWQTPAERLTDLLATTG
jgi:transposase, IS30 family